MPTHHHPFSYQSFDECGGWKKRVSLTCKAWCYLTHAIADPVSEHSFWFPRLSTLTYHCLKFLFRSPLQRNISNSTTSTHIWVECTTKGSLLLEKDSVDLRTSRLRRKTDWAHSPLTWSSAVLRSIPFQDFAELWGSCQSFISLENRRLDHEMVWWSGTWALASHTIFSYGHVKQAYNSS